MAAAFPNLTPAVETYLVALGQVHASGGATSERSSYPPLAHLLSDVGALLKPKVFCVSELADQGAGHPDFGLYATNQMQRSKLLEGQVPDRGVVEVKPAGDDAFLTAASEQVSRYWGRYRLVLVTNTRDFVLLGEDGSGRPVKLESFRLAVSAEDFHDKLREPQAFAREVGAGLGEYLARALSYQTVLTEPGDLAWLLASYARDGLARVDAAGNTPALEVVREALEAALGIHFTDAQGAHFFRSTLVQTLFYGVFSAWVLWVRRSFSLEGGFRWREAVWHLRVPVLRALFHQLSDPRRLEPLGLVEVLDWTAAALDRVDHALFFARFNEGEAVPYFYEPFLKAFDPDLRKQLGVWYTPTEVVRYMVARVDKALKDDLGIADGLAAENVYVLDPCCGTGAYLAEVLGSIAANLEGQGLGALVGEQVRRAAMERVFGFEIMPAPFVVAHLQVGLTLQALDAPLADEGTQRAQVFLTNALTGWESHKILRLPFPELAEERDQAERVKQDMPILVILGNPPYNGFAGMAVDEERGLSEAYRSTRRVRLPEGQGLNDLYVRFFRMAERRIVEKTGRGVVCFISNYSWLDGLSFTGMRKRYLEVFDTIRIDCLNGDKYKTGKVAPDGSPDPSIFSTNGNSVGIQVGTAIATLVRRADHQPAGTVGFRHLWGPAKPADLTETAEAEPDAIYEGIEPVLPLGLPFMPTPVSAGWFDWPSLPDLFPVSFPGVKTSRDGFLVDIDLDRLRVRVTDYFGAALGHEEIARRYPVVMKPTARFDAHGVRDALLKRGGPDADGFIRVAYRPFDNRWLYWEGDTKLLNEKRADYKLHIFEGNLWIVAQQKPRREWSPPQVISHLGCIDLLDRGATCFPVWRRDDGLGVMSIGRPRYASANVSATAQQYLERIGANVEDMFYHILAILHDPTYRNANAGALRMEWPRIPLPGWPDGTAKGAAEALTESAARGRELAALLNSETPVPGVTQAPLRPEFAAIAVPTTADGRNMAGDDFAVTAGWGHYGRGDAVMPGQGHAVDPTAMGDGPPGLGNMTFDIHLNVNAFWRNVPAAVWNYKLGGYQVLKKWLSYREWKILDRPLHLEEVQHFTNTARRIAAILRLYDA